MNLPLGLGCGADDVVPLEIHVERADARPRTDISACPWNVGSVQYAAYRRIQSIYNAPQEGLPRPKQTMTQQPANGLLGLVPALSLSSSAASARNLSLGAAKDACAALPERASPGRVGWASEKLVLFIGILGFMRGRITIKFSTAPWIRPKSHLMVGETIVDRHPDTSIYYCPHLIKLSMGDFV
jgi:hypothetical protein